MAPRETNNIKMAKAFILTFYLFTSLYIPLYTVAIMSIALSMPSLLSTLIVQHTLYISARPPPRVARVQSGDMDPFAILMGASSGIWFEHL